MHAKEVAVRITYIILGLVLSFSPSKAASERNNQYSLTEKRIKKIEKKILDDILMLKQTITEENGDEHKTELERLKKLTQSIQSNTVTAITKANEIQKVLEEEEAELQNLAADKNLVKARDILNHAASKSNPPNIMIEKSSKEYKDLTNTEEHRMGMKILTQSKELCSKIKKLSELFQKWTPTENALNIAKNNYFEAMNTEALNYIEEADRFFDGLSDPRSIKNKHTLTPPTDNTEKLQSFYNSILPSIFADKEQVEKYTQALKKMGEKRSKQLLANILHDLFQYQKNGKNGMVEQTREFYIKLKTKIHNNKREPELFKPFCVTFADILISKLSAIETAAIALLEMLQPGIDNPTSVTQRRVTKKLQVAVTKIQGESKQIDYKIICKLLRQDELDVDIITRWYLYDVSPGQKSQTKETQSASSEEAAKPLAGLETLLKYFNNLRILQEALFVLFKKLDVSYIHHKERQPEDIDLTDWLSSICIVTDAQALMLQTALNNQQGLLGKEEDQKKGKKPLTYAELSDLLSLWARMYRVYGYAEEKCIFLQHGKKILASEFRYSSALARQFLISFTTCAKSVIDNYQEVLSLRSNEKYTNEYIQLEREVKNAAGVLNEIDSVIKSGLSNFSMAYTNLSMYQSLYQDLLEDIDLNLKILAAKETSEIERDHIERQIHYELYIIKSLVDPKKVNKTELVKAIDNFENILKLIMLSRRSQLESIHKSFVQIVRHIFEYWERVIKIKNKIQKPQPEEEEESQSEQEYESQSEEQAKSEESTKAQSNPNQNESQPEEHIESEKSTKVQTDPNQNAETAKTMNQAPQHNNPITVSTTATGGGSPLNAGSIPSTQTTPPVNGSSKVLWVIAGLFAISIIILVAFYYFFMKKA